MGSSRRLVIGSGVNGAGVNGAGVNCPGVNGPGVNWPGVNEAMRLEGSVWRSRSIRSLASELILPLDASSTTKTNSVFVSAAKISLAWVGRGTVR